MRKLISKLLFLTVLCLVGMTTPASMKNAQAAGVECTSAQIIATSSEAAAMVTCVDQGSASAECIEAREEARKARNWAKAACS